MAQLFGFNQKRYFSLEEANQIIPLVFKITKEHHNIVTQVMAQLQSGYSLAEDLKEKLELEARDQILQWQNKIERLGIKPKGLWTVDFDSGSSYFCWKYPEIKITHWHTYEEGFTGRKPIEPTSESQTSAQVTSIER